MRSIGRSLTTSLMFGLLNWACARSSPVALGEGPTAVPTRVYLATMLAEDNPSAAGVTTNEDLTTSAGETRHYRLFVPGGYSAGHPAPLVLNLHGLNSMPSQ